MKIALISGSHRPDSESGRVARFIAKEIEANGHSTYVLELGKTPLPFWDESMWGKEGEASAAFAPISKELQSADAAVIIAAEWNGTVPAALNNFFHYTSVKEFGHKPAFIVSVCAGPVNGTYPVSELRLFSNKNNKLVYLPDHLIVRNVSKVLSDNSEDESSDAYVKERLTYSLNMLYSYAEALKPIRESDAWKVDKFNFGM